MSENVSRRNFVALAGAGVALGACSDKGTSSSTTAKKDDLKFLGGGDSWGELSDKKGAKHFPQVGNDKVDFTPLHLCLVYLRLDAGSLTAEHAYYKIAASKGDPAGFARSTLSKFKSDGWPVGVIRSSKDFEEFKFGSQQILYFYIDNGPNVVFDPNYLITFTKYGAKEGRPKWDNNKNPPVETKPKQMDPNNAFFNCAEVLPNMLTLENWFTTKNGKKFQDGDKPEEYSMNIHLKIKTPSGKFIPLVIDPDTGNGAGNEP